MNKLVSYSDSSDDDDNLQKDAIIKGKLPMPFRDDGEEKVEKADKSFSRNQHQGRIRTIAHIEGNWPSHIFIDCKMEKKN